MGFINLVIGSGAIANLCMSQSSSYSLVFYAAGVSDSFCTDQAEYDREFNRLRVTIDQLEGDQTLIYFSSCSIFDSIKMNTPYVRNKIIIEDFIKNNTNHFIIIRLPNLVSTRGNKKSIFNFFRHVILNRESFILYERFTRYLVQESLVREVIRTISEGCLTPSFLNVATPRRFFVGDIFDATCKYLGEVPQEIRKEIVSLDFSCNEYEVDFASFRAFVERNKISLETDLDKIIGEAFS